MSSSGVCYLCMRKEAIVLVLEGELMFLIVMLPMLMVVFEAY